MAKNIMAYDDIQEISSIYIYYIILTVYSSTFKYDLSNDVASAPFLLGRLWPSLALWAGCCREAQDANPQPKDFPVLFLDM